MDKQIEQSKLGLISIAMLAVIFLFSGIGKLIVAPDLGALWVSIFLNSRMLELAHYMIPYLEIAVGGLLIIGIWRRAVIIAALVLIVNFIINNFWLVVVKEELYTCGQCLGWGIDIWPIGSMFIDLVMLGLALTVLAYFKGYKKGVAHGSV